MIQRPKFSAPSPIRKCHGGLYGSLENQLAQNLGCSKFTLGFALILARLICNFNVWELAITIYTTASYHYLCNPFIVFFSSIHYPQWWTQWPRSLIIHFHMKNCVWCNWNNAFDTFMLEKYLKLQMSSGRQKNWITKQVAKPLIVS